MDYIFLNSAGQTLFVRSDIEEGHFVRQENTLTATFPFDKSKEIKDGQRIAFRDPANDSVIQVFEIRNVQNKSVDYSQSITAEHICISELSDEHINKTEITNKTAGQALTTALTGTLWSVGTNTASGTQDADFSRGSVWDAVCTIRDNWNVFISPRIVISSAGVITGRYLDIAPAQGTYQGLRLSVRKNLYDPCVTYDDSEVLTALYGYGGTVDKAHATGDDTQEELTFASVVWTATSEHPAKPSGQTYLEYPEKTALYGRNGRARFGYYQNGSITDPEVLLQKTWESLKNTCDPKVTIQGTVKDLYRFGYGGQPITLHQTAIVEIEETGELLNLDVICCDTDLVNPDNTQVEIGAYIPNIIYINRETNKRASGGGGGGGRGQTNKEDEEIQYYVDFFKLDDKVGMVVGTKDGVDYVKADQISLAINQSTGESIALIRATHIIMQGNTTIEDLMSGVAQINILDVKDLYAEQLVVDLTMTADSADFTQSVSASGYLINGDNNVATWQTETVPTLTFSSRYNFVYRSNGTDYTALGYLVGSHGTKTIHYLGSATT